jgi:acyl-coenzyme A synthetase/AMP-(fatty) acid ligase/acyl carrier protein
MPLGRPIPNTTLTVVDPAGQPLPPRLVGELVIEGVAVALGYLGADSHAFAVDEVTGRRRYRTGDLARLLADGTIEFVGRSDSQMKVRGTRVEPVEIENVLREHPDILDAVVVAGDDGEPIAHLVTDQAEEGDIDLASIRQFVSVRLPEAMVPGGWRVHESIPTTPSGKQDRRRLERMGAQPTHSSNGVRSLPRSDAERKLAAIWEKELGRSGVSITDSFFDLGGHSLLGVRMVSKISSSFDMKLPLRVIFETPTIESMAKFIEEAVDA